MIKCNYIEATKYAEKLRLEERALEKKLLCLRSNLRRVKGIIKENDENKKSWIVRLPEDVLEREADSSGKERRINWKKIVFELITKYDIPMSSDLLYHKLILNYNDVPIDRKFVLKNISAALHYLEAKDGKLFRAKDSNNRGFVYGLKHFFDFNMNIKTKYLKSYLREVGEDVEADA